MYIALPYSSILYQLWILLLVSNIISIEIVHTCIYIDFVSYLCSHNYSRLMFKVNTIEGKAITEHRFLSNIFFHDASIINWIPTMTKTI